MSLPIPAADRPRIFLIDGHALIYRAHYAMLSQPLKTKAGENTSIAWGIANFIHRLRSEFTPEYVAWVHDAGDSHRKALYPQYKSNRDKLEGEEKLAFDQGVVRTRQLLAAWGIPLVTVPGYEADDVIGTIATTAGTAGLQVVIVSGDKDFHQLVGPNIALLNPGRGGPAGMDAQWVDETNAAERLGVPPHQVIDYLALVGDSSDAVPGVKGIGEKTARELLALYGDLEAILANAAQVPKKRARDALLAQADNARLSKQLVTIMRDVPMSIALEQFATRKPNTEALTALLTELEFALLIQRFSTPVAPTPAVTQLGLGL